MKLKSLNDLTLAIAAITKELKGLKFKKEGAYSWTVKLYWPEFGSYHLDAGVLAAIVAKELVKLGLDGAKQQISCGLHQDEMRAGEIGIIFEERD